MEVCFGTLGTRPPAREFPSANKNCCNVTSRKKSTKFSVDDDPFPFSQHCMKPYSRKNLTVEEILFNHRLSRKDMSLKL